jgi:hypothetical protein
MLEVQKQFGRTGVGGGCWVRYGDFGRRFRLREDGESGTHPTSNSDSLERVLAVFNLSSTSALGLEG